MKRTFLARRNALLTAATVSWGVIALGFAILMLLVRLVAPNFFWEAFAPAFGVAEGIAARSDTFFAGFADTAALSAKNDELTKQNNALANENRTLLEKDATLSRLVGDKPADGVAAGVIAGPPESPYDTLVLGAGKAAGIAVGQEVFAEGGVPVGIVSAVTADFSRATLFSAPQAITHGWVGHSSLPVTIMGAGGGSMNISVSRSANVAVGDTVFVPGPGMLPIGSVVRVDSDPSSPGVTLRIAPTVSPFSLTWVLVRDTGFALRNSFSVATSTL